MRIASRRYEQNSPAKRTPVNDILTDARFLPSQQDVKVRRAALVEAVRGFLSCTYGGETYTALLRRMFALADLIPGKSKLRSAVAALARAAWGSAAEANAIEKLCELVPPDDNDSP